MHPLGLFHQKIRKINANNLDSRVEVRSKKNEIDLIASEFNFMMDRIEISYQKQKEFTAHASHELRTPLSRITSQIENNIALKETDQKSKNFLNTILGDVNQLTELINSLLILSKLENKKYENKEIHRLDEILFSAIEKLNKIFPDFVILFEMEESDNKQAIVKIKADGQQLIISVSNTGKTLTAKEQKNLFQPFMRGDNANGTTGFGLGLRIVQRILTLHNAKILYQNPAENTNLFLLIFHT